MTMLDKLYYDLQNYVPQSYDIETTTLPDKSKNLFSKLTNVFKSSQTTNEFVQRPKSLYIYGGAGCGKVLLLLLIIFVYVTKTYLPYNRVF